MSAASLLYGMAQDGRMPRKLAAVHRSRRSPWLATLAVSGVSLIIIVALRELSVVANLTNFALLAAFVMINLSVVVLRFREPDTLRPFRIPGTLAGMPVIPLLGIVTSLYMLSCVGWVPLALGLCVTVAGYLLYGTQFGFASSRPSSGDRSRTLTRKYSE
jgi:APA family basic amino acid/polyamine antiporter